MARKQNMIRTVVFLTPEQVKRLHALEKKHGVKPTESVRRALASYLKGGSR